MGEMNRKPTIYIAGPMRGFKDYNYPAFDRQQTVLEKQGWRVINPAEMDNIIARIVWVSTIYFGSNSQV